MPGPMAVRSTHGEAYAHTQLTGRVRERRGYRRPLLPWRRRPPWCSYTVALPIPAGGSITRRWPSSLASRPPAIRASDTPQAWHGSPLSLTWRCFICGSWTLWGSHGRTWWAMISVAGSPQMLCCYVADNEAKAQEEAKHFIWRMGETTRGPREYFAPPGYRSCIASQIAARRRTSAGEPLGQQNIEALQANYHVAWPLPFSTCKIQRHDSKQCQERHTSCSLQERGHYLSFFLA